MILIKALVPGLVGVSLCMANISGIVMDTGTTPVAGAVVQLENGGQTATTGADGSFTLMVTTAILSGNDKLLPIGLSARISGNRVNVSVAERTAVEVATFDLSGKALSTVRKTLDAGSSSISLPYQGAGIYLYKVKSGNSEVVLKGNLVNGVSSGSTVSSQGSSSNHLAKQAKAMAANDDVIAVTKEGLLNYRSVIDIANTSEIVIRMIANAGNVTDADGNVYQTVRIGNQVWMAENLRVTRYNDGSGIPKVTDGAAWYNIYHNGLTTPAYCFYNNTTNTDDIKKYGSLYNGYVVNPANTKKLAPAGWHVPTDLEWTVLEKYLVLNGYNWDGTRVTSQSNKIAKSLAAKTDWNTYSYLGTIGCDLTKNNSSGFSALPGGFRDGYGTFSGQSGLWWSATGDVASSAWSRGLGYGLDDLRWHDSSLSCGFSVRLLRDN